MIKSKTNMNPGLHRVSKSICDMPDCYLAGQSLHGVKSSILASDILISFHLNAKQS